MSKKHFHFELKKVFLSAFLFSTCFSVPCTITSVAFGENLEQAWEIAIRENNKLKASQQTTAAAQAGMQAAQAARMPRVTNATAYTVLSERPEIEVDLSGLSGSLGNLAAAAPELAPVLAGIPTSYSSPILNKDFLVSSTQAVLPLYTGGKITSLIAQADARAEAARQGERRDLLDLKMDVAENYFLVLRMNRIVQVLHETQRELEIHVQNTASLVEKGIVTENIHLSAQVSKAEIDQQILQAEQGFDLSKSAYNRYLGRPLDTGVSLEGAEIPPLSSEDIEGLTYTALQHRPELRALDAQATESCEKVKEYRSERLPTMSVAGGYTYIENDMLKENDFASASVCMVWTPLDGGVSRAKQRAAMHQTAAVNRTRDEVRSGIELQVRKCWLDERESRSRMEVARKSVEQATRNLEIVRQQFNEGIAPHTDYLQAVSLKTQAEVNFCNALCDAIIASYRLRRATGTI
ncbi:MAG: TolC family protein [Planctomycetia bacterium]|nr:TolC family protein [Planctomycetia bacterium]